MTGDPGPYMEMDGPHVWVPRTLPYLEARRVASTANENGDKLVYRGKVEASLLGFVRDCFCEAICELRYDENDEPTGDTTCRVPAWKFELVER